MIIGEAAPTVEDVVAVARDRARIELGPTARDTIERSRAVVDRAVHGDRLIYGLNTGLGHLRDQRVPLETLSAYQVGIIASHAGGTGEPLPDEDVRALIAARVIGAAQGGSGLHPAAVDHLCELLNRGVHPVVPRQGSVGAADLMHLAAVAMVLLGRGQARVGDRVLPGNEALAAVGLEPYVPLPKEGLALVSANAASIGLGALVCDEAADVAALADLVGALSLEAFRGNPGLCRADVAAAKPIAGQIAAAASLRRALAGSFLYDPGGPTSIQDPLSFRVMPQVHGALREQIDATRSAVECELGSVGDNPMVSIEADELVSTGNFQPMVLALSFEGLRLALAHVGLLAERRLQKAFAAWYGRHDVVASRTALALTTPTTLAERRSQASAGRFLSIYAAAADLAELRHLARPVTLDCPPLDFDVEDHATLAPTAVLYARRSLALLREILAIEAMLAVSVLQLDGDRRHGEGTVQLLEVVSGTLDALPSESATADAVSAVDGVAMRLARTLRIDDPTA